jgi:hypothetical protein
MKTLLSIGTIFLCALTLQAQNSSPAKPSEDKSGKAPAEKDPPPIDPKNMDTSIKPQDDF